MDSKTKIEILGGRAQNFDKLKKTDGWQQLRDIAAARKEKYSRKLTGDMMRGDPVDQRDIDYRRGFFDGIDYLLDSVDNAEHAFEAALKRANREDEAA